MVLHIELDSHPSLEDLRGFLAGNPQGTVLGPGRKQAYEHIGWVLLRFSYWKLGKADKGLLRRYLARTPGLSRAQLTGLIRRYLADRELRDRRGRAARRFPRPAVDPDPQCGRNSAATRLLPWRARARSTVCAEVASHTSPVHSTLAPGAA